jgi:enoyl-CoA hydratase
MSYENILYEVDRGVCTITLNRPEVRNALSFELIRELNQAVKAADDDPDVRCIVLAGAGNTFCSGHDLSAQGLTDYVSMAPNLECLWELEEDYYLQQHGLDIWYTDTPTIARVQGSAILGGFVLANVCDIVIAADNAIFWVPALRMHNMGAEVLMEPWVMGHRKAKEFLFTGGQIDANEAYRVGMVNRVVPLDNLEEATMEMATTIAMQPPTALKLAKRAINKTLDMQGFRNAVEHAFLLHVIGHGTQTFQEELWKPMLDKVASDGFREYLKTRDGKFGQA